MSERLGLPIAVLYGAERSFRMALFARHASSSAPSDCITWTGARTQNGYGKFWDGIKVRLAHRWIYTQLVREIPDGLELDHLCRNRACVNHLHLEPVTKAENQIRGVAGVVNGGRQSAVTHCPRGHEYSDANTAYEPQWKHPERVRRVCRACRAAFAKRWRDTQATTTATPKTLERVR